MVLDPAQTLPRSPLRHIVGEMRLSVAHGMSWIGQSEAEDLADRLDAIADLEDEMLTALMTVHDLTRSRDEVRVEIAHRLAGAVLRKAGHDAG